MNHVRAEQAAPDGSTSQITLAAGVSGIFCLFLSIFFLILLVHWRRTRQQFNHVHTLRTYPVGNDNTNTIVMNPGTHANFGHGLGGSNVYHTTAATRQYTLSGGGGIDGAPRQPANAHIQNESSRHSAQESTDTLPRYEELSHMRGGHGYGLP